MFTFCHYGMLKPHTEGLLYVAMEYCNITTCVNFMLLWDTENPDGVNYMLPWDIVTSRRVLTLCYYGILKPHTKGQHHDVC